MAKNNFYPEGLPSLLLWLQLQLVQWAAKYQLFGYTADEAEAIAKRIQAVIDQAGKVAALQASLAQEIKERDQLTSEFEGYYRLRYRYKGEPFGQYSEVVQATAND